MTSVRARLQLFHAVARKRFGLSTCFMCGRRLGRRNRADEHVIPRWAQDRFDLWAQQITLLNGTSLEYRRLTIPCCLECNRDRLGQIETDVSAAMAAGADAVRSLPERTLFLWLGKIFYGLLLREHFLKSDVRRPRSRPIVPRSLLESYDLHHSFIQAVRLPIEFVPAIPASVFVVPCQTPADVRLQFDLRDSLQLMTISMRLGSVGICAALHDGGAHRDHLFEGMQRLTSFVHHPLQFRELTAQFFYKASLLRRTPKFVIAESSDVTRVVQMPLGGLSARPVFDDWDQEEYTNTLAVFTGLPLSELTGPPGLVRSFTRNPANELVHVSLAELPWPLPRHSPETT
jgi:hypothetical protein